MLPPKLTTTVLSILFLFFHSKNMIAATEDAKCPAPIAASTDEIKQIRAQKTINRSPFIPQDLDCSYLKPPKHLTLIKTLDSENECQANKHNLKAMESGCRYYVSEDINGTGPIWCIQKSVASAKAIEIFTLIADAACNE